jgi:hypothetical protein
MVLHESEEFSIKTMFAFRRTGDNDVKLLLATDRADSRAAISKGHLAALFVSRIVANTRTIRHDYPSRQGASARKFDHTNPVGSRNDGHSACSLELAPFP